MASPTFVQEAGTAGVFESITASTTGASLSAFGSNVTAGNTVVLVLHGVTADVRTYSVSDDGFSTTYSSGTLSVNTNRVQIFYKQNHAGGAVTCAVRVNIGTQTCNVKAFEISETDGAPVESTYQGAAADVTTNSGYACGASGEIDTTDAAFIVAICGLPFNGTFAGPTSGWTELADNTTRTYAQYKEAASSVTNDRSIIPESGTNRDHASAMMAFYAPATGGSGIAPHAMHHRRLAA